MATEKWLTVKQMAEISGFSRSYFYTNKSLGKHGHKCAVLPPLVEVGRNLRCRESAFQRWLEGPARESSLNEAT